MILHDDNSELEITPDRFELVDEGQVDFTFNPDINDWINIKIAVRRVGQPEISVYSKGCLYAIEAYGFYTWLHILAMGEEEKDMTRFNRLVSFVEPDMEIKLVQADDNHATIGFQFGYSGITRPLGEVQLTLSRKDLFEVARIYLGELEQLFNKNGYDIQKLYPAQSFDIKFSK